MAIDYTPPGPQAIAFHQSDAFFRGLMGPVGSGKSSACCMEILTRALQQRASPDGVRRSRWAAVRNTYGELKSTTIKTWTDWFEGLQVMKWDTPIVSTITIPDIGDGTSMQLEVLFMALDRPEDAAKLKSLELTGLWMNEASELEKAVLDVATARVGRYPSLHLHGGASWSGVIADTNPPDDESWYHDLAEKPPEGYEFFFQPGGLYKVMDKKDPEYGTYKSNPLAENIKNLNGGYQYYHKQLAGKKEDYINVFLLAKYGSTQHGKPVYPEFNETIHVSKVPLSPIPGLPIVIGFDFGLTPAAVITQMSPRGQVLVLDEIIGESMSIRTLYMNAVLPLLNSKYGSYRIEAVGDPSGVSRSDTDEKSCFEELEDMGLFCEPASTNKFLPRRDAVGFFLERISGAGPGILYDPSCRMLIKGKRGGYRYERLQVSGETRFKDRPVKDKYSHPADAEQYACLHLRGDNQQVVAQPVKQVAWA